MPDYHSKYRFSLVVTLFSMLAIALLFTGCGKRFVIDSEGYEPVPNPPEMTPFTDGLGIEFIPIPAGTCAIGQIDKVDESYPLFEEEFSEFYLAATELTIEHWKKYFTINKSHGWGMWSSVSRYCETDDCPIVCLSKLDCEEFCKTMSIIEGVKYRLPTEFEWEYASRLGDSDDEINMADFYSSIDAFKHGYPVKTITPNSIGLYGMRSNASEWTSSGFLPYPDSEFYHPLYAKMAYVLRGGNFRYPAEVTERKPAGDRTRNYSYGLRVVRESK